ncbi:MAG: hypothetical protein RLY30_558 [Pseudomonadota bacterium]|jgi:flagellar basal body-associated protein FliL
MKIEFQVSLQGRLALIVVICIVLILVLIGAIGFSLGWKAGHSEATQTLSTPKPAKPQANPVGGSGS